MFGRPELRGVDEEILHHRLPVVIIRGTVVGNDLAFQVDNLGDYRHAFLSFLQSVKLDFQTYRCAVLVDIGSCYVGSPYRYMNVIGGD